MTGSQETCLQVFNQHWEEDKIPEVHLQLCHLLECHFKYLSPSFYTCEKGEHSHYGRLLMVVVTSGNTKGQLTLIEHLLYTSHSDKCLPVSASWRSLWMGLLVRVGRGWHWQETLNERWVYPPGEIKLQNYQSGLSNLFQLAVQSHTLRQLGWGWQAPTLPLSKVGAKMLPSSREAAAASFGPGWCPGLATELPVASWRGPRACSSLPRYSCFVVQSECPPSAPPARPRGLPAGLHGKRVVDSPPAWCQHLWARPQEECASPSLGSGN